MKFAVTLEEIRAVLKRSGLVLAGHHQFMLEKHFDADKSLQPVARKLPKHCIEKGCRRRSAKKLPRCEEHQAAYKMRRAAAPPSIA